MTKEKRTIDDTLLIPVLSPGDKLYHYTSAEGLKGICEGEFWITERSFLNDYTEFQVAKEVFKETLDRHMHNKEKCRLIKDAVSKEVDRLQTPGLKPTDKVAYCGDYVISFSLDGDSPLMWSEYSDFAGYCLAFDFDKLLESFTVKESAIMHGCVVYDPEEQLALMEKAIEHEFINWPKGFDYISSWSDFDLFSDEDITDFVQFMAVIITGYNMFFKLPCFEGEKEYRLIFSKMHDGGRSTPEQRDRQFFRSKDGVLIPFVKEPLKNLKSLEKVMVGAKNKSDIAVKSLRYFLRNLNLDVCVEKSQMPLRY